MNDWNKEPEFDTAHPVTETPEPTVPQDTAEAPEAPVAAEPAEPACETADFSETETPPETIPETQPEHAPAVEEPQTPPPYWAQQSVPPTQQHVPQSPDYVYAAPYGVYAQVDGPTAVFVTQRKRKMPKGLKALIIVMSILFGIAFLGFLGYCGYSVVTGIASFGQSLTEAFSNPNFSGPNDFGLLPGDGETEKQPDNKKPDKDDKEESSAPSEIVIPNIEVKPNTKGIQLNNTPNTAELDITEVYDKVMRSTVLVLVTSQNGSGSGTGIVATEDGYIITNSHVVLNSRNVAVQVKMQDGTTHDAVVVGFDKTTDLAVLKIEGTGYTPAEFADSNNLRMGQWVIAIGNPGGEQFSGSITRGVVSGLNRSVGTYSSNGMTYIQTDAAINPGNSGGPLVNMHGQVVGINSAKIVSDEYEGMGFAIPVTGAKKIIDDLLAGGYVEGRVRFGIKGTEINQMQAYMSDVPLGFMISEIDEDSCFVGTDVKPYDIITAIDGEETPTLDALSNALLNYSPGDTATVTLFRPNENGTGGEEFEVKVTLLADLGETQK